VQAGTSARRILALERHVRVPALQRPLATARRLVAQDVPTFVLGDFNSPSDLDWTGATVHLRDQVRYPLRWPASAAAEASGLVDSYRSVHPDPAKDPGLTWPASRPFVKGYNPGPAGQAADRIDLLFSGGPAHATSSQIVGERRSASTDIAVSPWPSDHRSVVSGFRITPARSPALVSVRSRLVVRGSTLTVDYAAAGDVSASAVVVTAAGGGAAIRTPLPASAPDSGSVPIDTTALAPGRFEASLADADGPTGAPMAFWVEAPGSSPILSTARRSYPRGDGIDLSWRDAPGDRNDWMAVFRRGGVPGADSYLGWAYIGPQIAGSLTVDGALHGVTWPLPRGPYTAYLLKDDGYDVVAHADFAVR
jgi:hypothetical protein